MNISLDIISTIRQIPCATAVPLLKQLFITFLRSRLHSFQGAELRGGVNKLDSTLQNSSEDQLLTVFLYVSEKYALNVNKEIIRLTISFL